MVSAVGKRLERIQGFRDGDGIRDSAVYLDGHTLVLDALGRDAGSPALLVRALDAANKPTEVFRVDKDGSSSGVGSGPYINVRSYGATGLGLVNDGPKIQDAITAATALGGVVYLPPGTYLVSAALTLPANVTLMGAGWKATKIVTGDDRFVRADQVDSPAVKNLYIDNSAASSVTIPVWFTRCTNAVVSGVYVYSFNQFGIELNGCKYSMIVDCVADTGRNSQNALMISNDFGASYIDAHCIMARCIVKGTGQNHDITIAQVRSVLVATCVCESNDLTVEEAGNVVVTGCKVQTGITYFASSTGDAVRSGCKIIGNTVVAATSAVGGGINVLNESTGKVSVIGNTVVTAVNYGIRANQSHLAGDLLIEGNEIWEVTSAGTGYGINVDYSASTVINDNLIDAVTGIGIFVGSSAVGFTCAGNRIVSPTSIGIRIQGKTGTITGNTITGAGAQGIYCDGVSDFLTVTGNVVDSALAGITFAWASAVACVAHANVLKGAGASVAFSGGATGMRGRNVGYVTENAGSASISDAGTITHGLAETPNIAIVTPASANIIAAVTALGATTFTVALKNRSDGSGAGATTVYWRASVAQAV